MDENEIILEGEYGEYEEQTEQGEGSGSPSETEASPEEDNTESVTDDQIIDAIRELINENNEDDIEGDDLLDNENSTEDPLEDVETVDYTEVLDSIYEEIYLIRTDLEAAQEIETKTIFDKQLNEYTVSEALLALGGLGLIVAAIIGLINHFTPKIWH